ncbi:SMI1/KNR4 family protein [Streptomyces sp. TS71-3]|uniref:SMI1/KNR4 family protein n=1 Tax=Streptomyces sp. TS71-3 TaxID=2733862 RepID=UPI001B215F5F|nr:SMI1/KNR4 family protein [Streptomyces sp. TS71-3]GHJ42156.1 hypothetical protein Sm713_77650 [Streptomyces sp. TS71-3]
MTRSTPLTVPEWREFLLGYSSEYLDSAYLRELAEDGRGDVDTVQRRTRWLGYGPAGEKEILAAEDRLGIRLPPSHRNFLLASNGWSAIAHSLYELVKVEEIGWFPDADPGMWDAWSHDEDITEQLRRSILLSGPADGDYWLLDASSIGPDGEWRAYWWWAGDGEDPHPYDSLAQLVVSAREEWSLAGYGER